MLKASRKPDTDCPNGVAASSAPPDVDGADGIGDNWRQILAVLPGIGTALLPKLTCPACWPAYAGLLGTLGLGFVNYSPYIFPLTVLFLILAVASLGYRAQDRRGYAPFLLGIIAAIVVMVGKFLLYFEPAMYGGIILLMGASLWNSWPQRRPVSGTCPACIPRGGEPGSVMVQTRPEERR